MNLEEKEWGMKDFIQMHYKHILLKISIFKIILKDIGSNGRILDLINYK